MTAVTQRRRSRSRPGVVLEIGEASRQRIVSEMARRSFLGLPDSRDNLRAYATTWSLLKTSPSALPTLPRGTFTTVNQS